MRQRTWKAVKWLSLSLSMASILVAGVLISLQKPSLPEQTSSNQTNTIPDNRTQVESPVIVERKDGKIIWQLRADEAKQQLNGQMHLSSPTLTLFTESGSKIPVSSRQAWFDPLRRNIRFQGKVQVDYQTWQLTSETLTYRSSTDQLLIPGRFILQGRSIHAKGKSMRIERHDGKIYVDNGISIDDTAPTWTGSGL